MPTMEVHPLNSDLITAALTSTDHRNDVTFSVGHAHPLFSEQVRAMITIDICWRIPGPSGHFSGRVINSSCPNDIPVETRIEGEAGPDGFVRSLTYWLPPTAA